jgi:hypothetical protein
MTTEATKNLSWAYASSDNAKAHGHPKTGCWVVQTGDTTRATTDTQEALQWLADSPLPVDRWSMEPQLRKNLQSNP